MPYLTPTDYPACNLPEDTPDALVLMASTLIDAHCRRPSLFATQYTERTRTNQTRTARLSYGPLAPNAITTVRVRYRANHQSPFHDIAQAFGLPNAWTTLDPAQVDVYAEAREVTLPIDLFHLGFSEAEITYTAGFTDVPAQVKAACAQIVRNAQATPALNVKSSRLDAMQMQYFAPTLLDADVGTLLKPYVAERLS